MPLKTEPLFRNAKKIADSLKLTNRDCCYLVMPLFHVHGLVGCLLATIAAGGSVFVVPKFSLRRFLDDIQKRGVTWTSCVPTMLQLVLESGEIGKKIAESRLRILRCCSAPLKPALEKKIREVLPETVEFVQAYAMTECYHQICSSAGVLGSVGNVSRDTNCEIKLRERDALGVGEILVRGPTVIRKYRSANIEAFEDGWLRTGDLGRIDDKGNLYLKGRLGDCVANRAGEKINLLELEDLLEEILAELPVTAVSCVALQDAVYGESIGAAFVTSKVSDTRLLSEIQARISTCLPVYKRPLKSILVESLPLLRNNKPDRLALKNKIKSA